MSLKSALQADLAVKGMNLGDLAEKLNITPQSVSKWIARDEIPKDRIQEVLAVVGADSHTSTFLANQVTEHLRSAGALAGPIVGIAATMRNLIGGKGAPDRLRPLPQPGDEDEDFRPRVYVETNRKMREPTVVVTSRSARPVRERWSSVLPEARQIYIRGTVEINEAPREFDYLSPELAILVRARPEIDATRLVSAAVPLMLLKQIRPSGQCWLVLLPRSELGLEPARVSMDDSAKRYHARRMETVKLDLETLGVKVLELDTAEEMASRIEAVESSELLLANPPFSYEDHHEET